MQVTETELKTYLAAVMRSPGPDLSIEAGADMLAKSILAKYSVQPQFEDIDNYVVPSWLKELSFQQQSVILLALRGPDGVRKHHICKTVHIAYRGTVLRAAERGRFLEWGEKADSFMSMDAIANAMSWDWVVNTFFDHVDELPHHYVSHLAHAAQIIGYKHPDERFRRAWGYFYQRWCDDKHVNPETEHQMDERLNDWGKAQARLGLMGIPFAVDYEDATNGVPMSCGCASCAEETIECVAVGEGYEQRPTHDQIEEMRVTGLIDAAYGLDPGMNIRAEALAKSILALREADGSYDGDKVLAFLIKDHALSDSEGDVWVPVAKAITSGTAEL